MSIWTHVVGCIRVDGIPTMSGVTEDHLRKILGPMCLYDKWDETSTLPRGSEGSLQYEIITYRKGLPWVVIPIWGDLRDFDSVEEIRKWWGSLPRKFKTLDFVMARDGILHIQTEGKEPVILSVVEAKDETIEA